MRNPYLEATLLSIIIVSFGFILYEAYEWLKEDRENR